MRIRVNLILIIILMSFFLFILSFLIININRGIDITDESYYILLAKYPNKVFSVISLERYYTNILWQISAHNLPIFRLLGITILLLFSMLFTLEFITYLKTKFEIDILSTDKILFVIIGLSGTLSYYRWWLLTPSYNWLTLLSIIIFNWLLLKIYNKSDIIKKSIYRWENFALAFAFCLIYFAKPTSVIITIIIAILFALFEYKKTLLLKRNIIIVYFSLVIILFLKIYFLFGSLNLYLMRLRESLEIHAILGGGHTLGLVFKNTLYTFTNVFFEEFYFHNVNKIYLSLFILAMVFLFVSKVENEYNKSYFPIFILLIIFYYYLLLIQDIYYRNINHKEMFSSFLWLRLTEFYFLMIILNIAILVKYKIKLKNTLLLFLFLFVINLNSIAYSFGTNNTITSHMSGSIVFVGLTIMTLIFLTDKILNVPFFKYVFAIFFLMTIFLVIHNAYRKPYRLVSTIKEQNLKINFLGTIYVDRETFRYITDLNNIKLKNNPDNKDINLIDLTGGSPAANLILEAGFFDYAWLLGGYPGSETFVTKILNKHRNSDKLREAWILIAPEGTRKISNDVLRKVGLSFPEGYIKIGEVFTPHRKEIQELWKPKE